MAKWQKIIIGIIIIIIILIIGFLTYINTAFISKKEVEENLIKHLEIKEEDIYFENIELELEKQQYEVDFYYNNNEYEAKVDAKEGKIIYTNFSTTQENPNQDLPAITLEKAKELALEHANIKEEDVTLTKAKEETENGTSIYEIEYKDSRYEYEFDITLSGEIIHYDKDRINN